MVNTRKCIGRAREIRLAGENLVKGKKCQQVEVGMYRWLKELEKLGR